MKERTNNRIERRPMPAWYAGLKRYMERSWTRGTIQLLNTLVPYIGIMVAMTWGVIAGWPWWQVPLMAIPAAFFLVRTFIIFHDCAHGSFFPSDRANRIVGFITGVLTFTSFETWRVSHLKHHATNGQLDHRGVGDVLTMTYEEYRDASRLRRFGYRLYRNPVVLFIFGPLYTFVLTNRIAGLGGTTAERRSTIWSDVGLIAVAAAYSIAFGFWTYVIVQITVIIVAGTMGIWLFYVQHQFDPGYWEHDDEWDKYEAAMSGASYYRLPALLRWFTGNIGIHHLHHLQPRIPNYRLRDAFLAFPEAQDTRPLTIRESIKSIRINLWSEVEKRFLSFRQAHRMMRAAVTQGQLDTRS